MPGLRGHHPVRREVPGLPLVRMDGRLRMSEEKKPYKGGDPNWKPSKEPKDFTKNIVIPPHMRAGGGKKK